MLGKRQYLKAVYGIITELEGSFKKNDKAPQSYT